MKYPNRMISTAFQDVCRDFPLRVLQIKNKQQDFGLSENAVFFHAEALKKKLL